MTVKRKPLKPVKGWVVVGLDGYFTPNFIRSNAHDAWDALLAVDGWDNSEWWKRLGYRAVPVVVMERGKK